MSYKFGDNVYYTLRGVQRVGVITWIFTTAGASTKNTTAYHVRDDDGYYWHRTDKELAPYPDGIAEVPLTSPSF